MPHRGENKRNSTLRCTKTGGIQPKLNVACFVQSCLTDADFVIFSNYCLIGTRPRPVSFCLSKKPRRVCRPQAAKQVWSVFCGGVYVAKNTSQSASVEFVRFQRTNSARSRLQAPCPKRPPRSRGGLLVYAFVRLCGFYGR